MILLNNEKRFEMRKKAKQLAGSIQYGIVKKHNIPSIVVAESFGKNSGVELINAYKELAFQIEEKEKRALELIKINNDLKLAQTGLYEVNKELEAFTYSVAHDLRAPLWAVNSYAQILQEDHIESIDDDGKQILQHIRSNAVKMGALIDELLTFSRLGRKEIDRIDVDMNDLIKSILDDAREINHHRATINVTQLPIIKADNTLLRQVLFNLISNAIKYSSKKEHPIIDIFTELKDGETVFAVKDNGAGFDMRFLDKLFKVFQRLHSDEDFEGHGVGLAIVERIIHKHGGQVWAEGKEDEGATFYFTLN